MPLITIKTEWEVFEQKVVPKDASPEQKRDMMNAFWGGAMATFMLLTEVTTKMPDEAAEAYLNLLNAELKEFMVGLAERAKAHAGKN